MKRLFGKLGVCLLAGLIVSGFMGYALFKGELEPYNNSVALTLLIGFAAGCFAGFFLTLYDKVQAWKKSDDTTRWAVRHAGLAEFVWWVLFLVCTIATIGVATLLFT